MKAKKVLLLGNGINRLLPKENNNYLDWEDLVKNIIDSTEKENYEKVNHIKQNVLIATTLGIKDERIRKEKLVEQLERQPQIKNPILNQLLEIPFDAILTTNYTYEIEREIDSNFEYKNKKHLKYSKSTFGSRDRKTFIKTYNHVQNPTINHNIWHIHGEVRNKESIIFDQNDYGNQLYKIKNYLTKVDRNFNNGNLDYLSWIDYFVYGEVYSVGLGFDFSEFDLWWLLARRKRTKSKKYINDFTVYRPYFEENVENNILLKGLGVSIEDFSISDFKKDEYILFYKKIIEDIKNKMRRK